MVARLVDSPVASPQVSEGFVEVRMPKIESGVQQPSGDRATSGERQRRVSPQHHRAQTDEHLGRGRRSRTAHAPA